MAVTFISDGAAGLGITPVASTSLYNGVKSGSVEVDTSVKEHGYSSFNHDSAAGNASAYIARLACLGATGGRIAFRFRAEAGGAGSATAILRMLNGTTTGAQLVFDNNRNLRIQGGTSGTTNIATGSTALTLNQWYHIAVCYTITSASVNEWRVYLDGALEITGSNIGTQNTGINNLRIGWTGTGPGANVSMWHQDLYVDDSTALTYPGNIRVTNKFPSAAGANNNFDTAVGSGTNRWDRVNERPGSTSNRYQQAASSQVAEQFTVQTASVGDDDISTKDIVCWAPWVNWSIVASAGATSVSMYANGSLVGLTSTAASGSYQTMESIVASTSYPSGNTAVGLRSSGAAADTHLAECGVFIAYIDGAGYGTVNAQTIPVVGGSVTGTDTTPNGTYRWYTDATPDGSLSGLAAANTAPTLTGAQTMNGIIRLRVQLTTTVSALHMEYSVDGTNWADIPNADGTGVSNNENRWFLWANGAASAGGTIGTQLLTGTQASGIYIESRGQTATVSGSNRTEFDLAFKVRWPPPDTTILLRLLDGASPITLPQTISLTTCAAADRSYTIDKADTNASGGQNREVNHSSWPRMFHDGTYWWTFVSQPQTSTSSVVYYRWSGSGAWTKATIAGGAGTITSTAENDVRIAPYMRTISSTPVAGIGLFPSSGNMRYLRGYVSSGTFTWASPVDVGASRPGSQSHACIDQGGYHWIGGINGTSGVWARRSSAADDGSSGYVPSFGSSLTQTDSGVAAGDILALVPLASNSVLAIWRNAGDLKAAEVTGSGWGSVQQVNSTTDANADDWGAALAADGLVYVVHSDSTSTGGTWRTRTYDPGTDTWAAGTDPSITGQNSNADGLVVTAIAGGGVAVFGTDVGTEGGQDRTIQAKTWNGSTWSSKTVITPAGDRGNGDDIAGPPVSAAGTIPILYLFNDCDTDGAPYTYEYHQLAIAGDATGTVSAQTIPVAGGSVTGTAGQSATGTITGQTIPVAGGSVTGTAGAADSGTVSAQTIPVAGGSVTGTAGTGDSATVTGQTIPVAGGSVTATTGAGDTGTVSAQTVPVEGGSVTGSAGVLGTITGQTIPVTGGTVTGSAGTSSDATGTVSPQTIPVTGGSVTGTAGALGTVTGQTVPVEGGSVTGTAGTGATGTVSAQTIPATGGSVTGTAGALGTVSGQTIPVEGGLVTGNAGSAVDATGSVLSQTIPVVGGSVTGTAGASGSVAGQTIPATGGTVSATTGQGASGIVVQGVVPASGGITLATAGQAAQGIVASSTISVVGGVVIGTGSDHEVLVGPITFDVDSSATATAYTGIAAYMTAAPDSEPYLTAYAGSAQS